jgi:8-oxo-dGTP pyrophosphatase MutT (NUDIX family)
MVIASNRNTIFAPARFFPLAESRVRRDPPPIGGEEELGDHQLNPGFLGEGLTYRNAAVLIPVVAREPEATVLLTQRTPHLSAHAGQIAFPGGKIEATDRDAGAAALREAAEEIGLAAEMVNLIGYLDPYLTRTGYRIVPVLARVDPGFHLRLNAGEVEEAFEVPLGFLMTAENHHQNSRVLLGKPRYFYEMPFEGRYIWGVTAGIIRALYERVLG